MQRYCIQNISQTNQKWEKLLDLNFKDYFERQLLEVISLTPKIKNTELRFTKTENYQTLSCVVIKQINDKVLIIRLCRVSGEGAIEIIMVGSPGVLIVRVPGTGAA